MDKESSTYESWTMLKQVMLGNLKGRDQFEFLYKNKK
jgi:hypothetical protein